MSDWNRVLILRRLRWPLLLLLTGVIALLDQLDILTWDHAWPLYLILLGVLGLAERAALATLPPSADPYGYGYPVSSYPASGYPADPSATPTHSTPSWTQNTAPSEQTGIVPVSPFPSLTSTSTSVESSEDHSGEEHRS